MAYKAPNGEPVDRLLTVGAVTSMIPYTSTHLMRLAKRGEFPSPKRLGGNRVAFKESEILAWIESRERGWQSKAVT